MAQADINSPGIKDYNGSNKLMDADGDVRQDIHALKENIRNLTRHLQKDGIAKADEFKGAIGDGIDSLLAKSDDVLLQLENEIRDNPRRSLVVAFVAGFALNLLMRKG